MKEKFLSLEWAVGVVPPATYLIQGFMALKHRETLRFRLPGLQGLLRKKLKVIRAKLGLGGVCLCSFTVSSVLAFGFRKPAHAVSHKSDKTKISVVFDL